MYVCYYLFIYSINHINTMYSIMCCIPSLPKLYDKTSLRILFKWCHTVTVLTSLILFFECCIRIHYTSWKMKLGNCSEGQYCLLNMLNLICSSHNAIVWDLKTCYIFICTNNSDISWSLTTLKSVKVWTLFYCVTWKK